MSYNLNETDDERILRQRNDAKARRANFAPRPYISARSRYNADQEDRAFFEKSEGSPKTPS
ncbi:hypothetical protein LPN04_29480 [Rugamonas sp. A1-17]|nr:hypothetical protein [Rugamonas sp. A1-17]